MKMHIAALVAVLAAGLLLAAPATAATATRVYLLQSSGGDGYWSIDRQDQELSSATIRRTCGSYRVGPGQQPCTSYFDAGQGTYQFSVPFAPATRIEDVGGRHDEAWRFRFVLDVAAPLPFTVHAAVAEDLSERVSAAATEVSPGVWEGEISDRTPFSGAYNQLFVVIRTQSPGLSLSLAAAGQSWFELPRPIVAKGVPELRAASPPVAAGSYHGAGRTLWFNDAEWSAAAFEGDLTAPRSFSFDLPRAATSVIAWVETYDTPLVFDVATGREPDARKLENAPALTLAGENGVIAEGTNSGIRGRGQDAVAAMDVAPGQLLLQVRGSSWDPDGGGQELPYELHVVAVHGERTLRGMRWRFGGAEHFSSPNAAACPYGLEPVPVPASVSTFAVDVDWTTYAQPLPDFTLNYALPSYGYLPCGELNADDRVRFTLPPSSSVWLFGPTPAQGSTYSSANDTVFEMQVDYTYDPAV